MACKAIIKTVEGGTSFEVSLPHINSLDELSQDTMRQLAVELSKSPEIVNNIKSTLKESKIRKNRWEVNSFDETGLPIGNVTLNELQNKYYRWPEVAAYAKGLADMGINLDKTNILLLNTEFEINGLNYSGIYKNGNSEVVILSDDVNGVKSYLSYLYNTNWLKANPDSWQAKRVHTKINDILTNIRSRKEKSEPTRLDKIINVIENDDDFLRYYQMSAYFKHAINMFKDSKNLKWLVSSLIDPKNMEQVVSYHPVVNRFIDLSKKVGTNDLGQQTRKISKENLNSILTELQLPNIEKLTQYLNDKDANIEVLYDETNSVTFVEQNNRPLTEENFRNFNITTDYYSSLTNLLHSYGEYKVYEVDGKYYVENKLASSKEDIDVSKPFDSLDRAIMSAHDQSLHDKLDFDSYKLNFKRSFGLPFKSELGIGDKFQVIDVNIAPQTELTGYDKGLFKLIESKKGVRQIGTVAEFQNMIKSDPKYKKIGVDLSSLDTKEKIETFFLLKEDLRDPSVTFDSPNQLIPARIAYEKGLVLEALNKLNNAEVNTYEVIANNNGNTEVKKINSLGTSFGYNTEFQGADTRNELFNIANRLSTMFGVTINLINSNELPEYVDKSKNAFILNGEVYINVDNASPKDVLHEYGHLILGTIKQRNPKLYYTLVNKMESLSNFGEEFDKLKAIMPNRAETDLKEELFVDMFGRYFVDKEKVPEIKNEIKKIFGLSSSLDAVALEDINNMTLNDLMLNFGSIMLSKESTITDYGLSANSRVAANLIEKLIKDGVLKEDCNG